VCVLHHAEGDEEHEFLILASKQRSMVSWFEPQNRQLRFDDLEHKITATISWFGPQNQVEYDLLVVPQNRWEDEDSVGHASRSSSLLHLEASQARVSQFCLKTGEGATASGARDIIMAITWK
jgi:phage-related baseplate assembly protein